MTSGSSFDLTGNLFFTKYSNKDVTFRGRFRSFQTTALGNAQKMEQIEQMFNNYNLFKYGRCVSNPKKNSLRQMPEPEPNRHKNNKQRMKDSENMKKRLDTMKTQRNDLFQKLKSIKNKSKKAERNP